MLLNKKEIFQAVALGTAYTDWLYTPEECSSLYYNILYYLSPFITTDIFLDKILHDPSGTNTDL